MKTIYLIRHCKAQGQEPDATLTLEGHAQAEAITEFLMDKDIEWIISSPYLRAIHSIEPFSRLSRIPINVDPRLSERVLSSEGMADWMDKLKASFEDIDLNLPGGESSAEAADRGVEVIREIAESSANPIVVVTHGNLLSLIINHFKKEFGFNEWKGMTNPDVFELLMEKDKFQISRIWK
ncbi:histidine phosphatase family protein [Paenibacillus sacheonensis]|uniref:Histidine phosphatase family protein n=1 Tax=Paenibacillus sacheonensis TaxID=742054 RepID=A0A7X4YNH0_9BACL|nr:histidine phosphatase family protein [Paenibacillus sacheonensis]MBM7565513.1 2,3-bisphosphoglycerate-dependent phosphoglycerate mutase [Paenibacillus sacheonensis]NBC69565.1 histidine phosphatase family protein [Paenibacillus sacheonensis]